MGYAASGDMPIGWLHIDAAFLARSIRLYVERPDDRAAMIGTEQGQQRLLAVARTDQTPASGGSVVV